MGAAAAFIYSDEYFSYDYGPHHPLRMERLKLTHDLIHAYGLLDRPDLIFEMSRPADPQELESFHRPDYLEVLRGSSQGQIDDDSAGYYGFGPGDNPIFSGMWELALLATGASLQAARLVAEGLVPVAFNMAGGMHHAFARRAAGFCYVNDVVVAIKDLLKRGLRIIYLDIDAHHGDGVQTAFYDTDQVLTISLHQHGHTLFPGTGFVYETGTGRGQGYSVNVPLYPGSDDEIFLKTFDPLIPDLIKAYQPDILVTQLGVDTLRTDPLTDLDLTTNGFTTAVQIIKDLSLPWVALGGGGYHIVNVARAWTLAWGIMTDQVPPDELPPSFVATIRPHGYWEEHLRDKAYRGEKIYRAEAETMARQAVETLRQTILPLIKKR